MPSIDLSVFIQRHMRLGERFVPARAQAALALLERLRDTPSLSLNDHKDPGSSGLRSHETFGEAAHKRLAIGRINRNHGRRSSSIGDWGQELLDHVARAGFAGAHAAQRSTLIDDAQECFAAIIRSVLDQDPILVRTRGRSVEAVIRDVLEQAENKGKSGDVAQYLVGAKLMLRLNREVPVHGSNLGDRRPRADDNARSGDFEIENATIEVAFGLPDDKHVTQIADALQDTDAEVWLLTRHDRVATWRNEIDTTDSIDRKRVVVGSVEGFIGQNITEMGSFSITGKVTGLSALFELYNERWIAQVGTPGIRIAVR
jgi:hypothetical protein